MEINIKDDQGNLDNEVDLRLEELEEVIAPVLIDNHNETMVEDDVDLNIEEMEEVIAPVLIDNHNETFVF